MNFVKGSEINAHYADREWLLKIIQLAHFERESGTVEKELSAMLGQLAVNLVNLGTSVNGEARQRQVTLFQSIDAIYNEEVAKRHQGEDGQDKKNLTCVTVPLMRHTVIFDKKRPDDVSRLPALLGATLRIEKTEIEGVDCYKLLLSFGAESDGLYFLGCIASSNDSNLNNPIGDFRDTTADVEYQKGVAAIVAEAAQRLGLSKEVLSQYDM